MKSIEDYVDVRKYKWVAPYNVSIKTVFGRVDILRGTLFDGASGFGIADLEEECWSMHDLLFRLPVVIYKGRQRRLTKTQCDLLYGICLFKHRRIFRALLRPLGLSLFGWSAWRAHRRLEASYGSEYPRFLIQEYMVPQPTLWNFPNWHTKEAEWVGSS